MKKLFCMNSKLFWNESFEKLRVVREVGGGSLLKARLPWEYESSESLPVIFIRDTWKIIN